jgi:hypothetical protein
METGLIVGLFVGFALLADCWCESYETGYVSSHKHIAKLIGGILLVTLANIGLFYV